MQVPAEHARASGKRCFGAASCCSKLRVELKVELQCTSGSQRDISND